MTTTPSSDASHVVPPPTLDTYEVTFIVAIESGVVLWPSAVRENARRAAGDEVTGTDLILAAVAEAFDLLGVHLISADGGRLSTEVIGHE